MQRNKPSSSLKLNCCRSLVVSPPVFSDGVVQRNTLNQKQKQSKQSSTWSVDKPVEDWFFIRSILRRSHFPPFTKHLKGLKENKMENFPKILSSQGGKRFKTGSAVWAKSTKTLERLLENFVPHCTEYLKYMERSGNIVDGGTLWYI